MEKWQAEQLDKMLDAVGLPISSLEFEAQQIVKWLAGMDEHTVRGICSLIRSAQEQAVRELVRAQAEAAEECRRLGR